MRSSAMGSRVSGRALALIAAASLLLGGCATTGSGGGVAAAKPEPVIVRPVVKVESAVDEMLAVMDLLKEGNLRQAEANLEEILKVRPDIPEAHLNLGWVKQRLGKHAEALAYLESGLRLRPGDPDGMLMVAYSQREMGRFDLAEASYKKLLAAKPERADAHLNLGVLYELYLFQPALALQHYRTYQGLQATPDTKVAGWIAVLERQEARK